MHIAFILLSTPLILLGCMGLLMALRRLPSSDWAQRRKLNMLALVAPVIALGIGLSGLHDFLVQVCGLSEQLWYALVITSLVLMALVAVGAFLLGLVRLMVFRRAITRNAHIAPAELQALTTHIARQLNIRSIQVLLCDDDKPLALTWGVRQPKLLLSKWMLQHLDEQELLAVLAHELAHVKRRDFFFSWLTTLLRDAFFYLPASRAAHNLIKKDNELACDDLAVCATGDPLALASALGKVWQHALNPTDAPTPSYAQALLGARHAHDLEMRIERLLALSDGVTTVQPAQHRALRLLSMGLWAALALLLVTNLVMMFGPFGCADVLAICM